jgi:GNAT superfamily N-acetyltransferase
MADRHGSVGPRLAGLAGRYPVALLCRGAGDVWPASLWRIRSRVRLLSCWKGFGDAVHGPASGRVHLGCLRGVGRTQQRDLRRLLVHRISLGLPARDQRSPHAEGAARAGGPGARGAGFDEQGLAQGWCQYGSPDELDLRHGREYRKDPPPPARWRITCIFVDKRHRGQGIARAGLEGALAQIAAAGGGLVEAISETTTGREAHSRFLFSATAELFEQYGFAGTAGGQARVDREPRYRPVIRG